MRNRREIRYLEDQTLSTILFFVKNFLKRQRFFGECFAFVARFVHPGLFA